MTSQDYDQDIKENQDLIKELNLTHPCKNVCSGYRQVVEEATPEMLKTNNYVKVLIHAAKNSLEFGSNWNIERALEPFEGV